MLVTAIATSGIRRIRTQRNTFARKITCRDYSYVGFEDIIHSLNRSTSLYASNLDPQPIGPFLLTLNVRTPSLTDPLIIPQFVCTVVAVQTDSSSTLTSVSSSKMVGASRVTWLLSHGSILSPPVPSPPFWFDFDSTFGLLFWSTCAVCRSALLRSWLMRSAQTTIRPMTTQRRTRRIQPHDTASLKYLIV